jgi:hypothetical protein
MDVADHKHLPLPDATSPLACANCGAALSGRYCSSCGQRSDTAAHSVGHFLWEAVEALTHADSRVWVTLQPLLRRPGFLTREFFAGRRARYVQPLRLYLILSVVFLVLSALLNNGPARHADHSVDKPLTTKDCANQQSNVPWVAVHVFPLLKAACENMVADNGRQFSESLVRNMGRAMFVFLPLMAALMKVLYWRPRHYYLEHLVLLIHNHACVFLLLSIFMLATHWLNSGGWVVPFVLAMIWYLPRYLYRSMKVMYGQSGLLTFLKFNVLVVAYLLCGSIMLAATALVSAGTL